MMSQRRAAKETNLSQSIVEKIVEGFIPYWTECQYIARNNPGLSNDHSLVSSIPGLTL